MDFPIQNDSEERNEVLKKISFSDINELKFYVPSSNPQTIESIKIVDDSLFNTNPRVRDRPLIEILKPKSDHIKSKRIRTICREHTLSFRIEACFYQ